jgi:hypothetical protein
MLEYWNNGKMGFGRKMRWVNGKILREKNQSIPSLLIPNIPSFHYSIFPVSINFGNPEAF